MTDEKNRLRMAGLALLSIAGLFASIGLSRSAWVEEDAIYEIRASATPTLDRMAPHQKKLSTLQLWNHIVEAFSAASLAGLAFLLQRHRTAHAVWLRTLMFGLLALLFAVILLLSAGKGNRDERSVAVPMAGSLLLARGLILSAGMLTWTTGRVWAKIVGVLLILLEALAFVAAGDR